jgi:CelD/BcsL family acetyltransferase involved in cellulose biosynthesis
MSQSTFVATAPLAFTSETVRHATTLPVTAYVSLISNLHGLQAIEKQWRALEANPSQPITVFQSYDWIKAWCETYCTDETQCGLHLITGYDNDKLMFVWPLAVTRRHGITILSWLTEPYGQYGDVICAQGQCPRQWIGNALRLVERLAGIDMLRLRHVRADSILATVAEAELTNARYNERAPYLDLTAYANEAAYDERYSSTQRKRRKKIRKALEDMGPVSFQQLPIGALSDKAMNEAFSEKNKWLAERGRINRVMGETRHIDFLKKLSRTKSEGVEVVVTELKAGDTPVSWEIGFRFSDAHFAYITSHVNNMTDLSPGRLHMDLSQRACLAAGLKRFDLMVPYDAHKESWSSACMPTEDYFLALTWKGKLAGHAYLKTIRPWLRATYYKLPQNVLRLINRGQTAS